MSRAASREPPVGGGLTYKLSLEASAKAGAELGELARRLGLSSIAAAALGVSTDLAQSPTGAVTADRASYKTGDPVPVRVRMDAGALSFLGLYNIDRILLVRHAAGTDTVLGTQSATPGQSEFTFTAPGPVSAGELFAFVITTLLPLDLLPLEVGKAVSTSGAVPISAGGDHTCAVLPDGTVSCWGQNKDPRPPAPDRLSVRASQVHMLYNVRMRRYSVAQARARLAELLNAAEQGRPVVIERRGVRFTLQARRSALRSVRRAPILEIVDPAVADGRWMWTGSPQGVRLSRARRAR